MNILMALSQFEVTGAEVYAVTLADELIKRGHKVYIASDTLTKPTLAEYISRPLGKRRICDRMTNMRWMYKFIEKNEIQIIHSHSRATSWVTEFVSGLKNIPFINTIHGRQPVHTSRKIVTALGDYTLPVCENIAEHLKEDFKLKEEQIEIIRNPIDDQLYNLTPLPKNEVPVISLIGRLSGPKGDVAYSILEKLSGKEYKVRVIGGNNIPERFKKFESNIEFIGYSDSIQKLISESDLIIGAGRVAVEGILSGRPVIAVGESDLIGLITPENLSKGLESNFGDVGRDFHMNHKYSKLQLEIENALKLDSETLCSLRENVKNEYSKKEIVDRIEKIYQREHVLRVENDIPVIMYHRIVEDRPEEKGKQGLYTLKKDFEEHLKYLSKNGYETLTFRDLSGGKYVHRFDGKKRVILTFDDGYEDNYRVAFPLLKKYNSKATIYLMGGLDYNKWDVEHSENPEDRFRLMTDEEIKEMQESGLIEFGVHTMTHPRLSTLSEEEIHYEIFQAKENIEKKLNEKTITFAYPYGDLDERAKKIAIEAGFEFIVATDSGPVCFSDDLAQIRRIAMFSSNSIYSFRRKVSGKYNFTKIKREIKKKLNSEKDLKRKEKNKSKKR